jgi:hypothetical protein
MDLIELTLRGVMLVCALFVACGFGGLACEAIESRHGCTGRASMAEDPPAASSSCGTRSRATEAMRLLAWPWAKAHARGQAIVNWSPELPPAG